MLLPRQAHPNSVRSHISVSNAIEAGSTMPSAERQLAQKPDAGYPILACSGVVAGAARLRLSCISRRSVPQLTCSRCGPSSSLPPVGCGTFPSAIIATAVMLLLCASASSARATQRSALWSSIETPPKNHSVHALGYRGFTVPEVGDAACDPEWGTIGGGRVSLRRRLEVDRPVVGPPTVRPRRRDL